MGLKIFTMMYNASQSGSLQPHPPQSLIIYVSTIGTGDGLTPENPTNVDGYDDLIVTDNLTILSKADEQL